MRLLATLETGQRDKIKEFIEANFASGFLAAIPVHYNVNMNARMAAETRGFLPRRIVTTYVANLNLR